MTNEKFLEILTDIKGAYAYDDSFVDGTQKASQLTNDDLAAFVKALGGTTVLPFIVEQAIRTVKADIAQKALSSPNVKRLTVCKKILRNAKATTDNMALWYANTIDGVQYVADRHRAAAFKTPLPLEEKPDNVPEYDFIKIFSVEPARKAPLELPDRKQLGAYIKVKKAEQSASQKKRKEAIRYNFGKDLPMVNAEYLADMMDIFPNAKFYADGSSSNICIRDSNGDEGLLCRIRKPDEDTEKTVLT